MLLDTYFADDKGSDREGNRNDGQVAYHKDSRALAETRLTLADV